MLHSQASRIDRILVVDDSPDNLMLVQATLESSRYEIIFAEDGKTALAKVEKFLPDLIMLDVMMPEMDGYEVTQHIRQNKKLSHIPILLITADERSSVVKGLDVGADDFIRKPFDIDELLARVRSLLRLKHSIDEREQLSRQREDFVSRLTHDLRTPLVAADRMLQLFQQDAFGEISSEMHAAIDSMIHSNKNLLQMVNTLLEVYRHEAGYKELNFSACNLREVVQDVARELVPLANEQGLALTTRFEGNGESADQNDGATPAMTIMGDRLELHRVLANLVGNAIKFTDQGFIEIRLIENPLSNVTNGTTQITNTNVTNGANQTTQWVTIEVKDTGVGISPEDQVTLFERFRRGGHKRAGSGLGLYLSRRIIESHKGTIDVQSELGQGSLFTVRLPVHQSSNVHRDSATLPPTKQGGVRDG